MRFMDTCRIYLHILQAPALVLTVLKFCLPSAKLRIQDKRGMSSGIFEARGGDLLQVGILGRRMWITPQLPGERSSETV